MTSEGDLRHIRDAAQPDNACNYFLSFLLLSGLITRELKAIKVHFTEKNLKATFIFILICVHTQFYKDCIQHNVTFKCDISQGNKNYDNHTLPNMPNNLRGYKPPDAFYTTF